MTTRPAVRRPAPSAARGPGGRSKDESGAIAVMVGVLALVLLGVGALAVDLGQIFATRAALQSDTDLAVLAAAAELDGSTVCTAAALDAARRQLDDPQLQATVDLADGDRSNGELVCDRWLAELWGPEVTVEPGLARAVGVTGEVDVPAYAAARVHSPAGAGVFPAFTAAGGEPDCSWGPQFLIDDALASDVPGLPDDADPLPPARTTPLPTAIEEPNDPIDIGFAAARTVLGTNLESATHLAFSTAEGDHVVLPVDDPSVTVSDGRLTIDSLPAAVVSTEGTWWVRLTDQESAPTRWTAPRPDLTISVGEQLLTCRGDLGGAFGTVSLPPGSVAANIRGGPAYALSIHPSSSGPCAPGVGGSIVPRARGTNCVLVTPGFSAADATSGLITSTGARLDRQTGPGCSPERTSASFRTPPIGGRSYWINDDVLTCYFTDAGTRVADVARPSYAGGRRISAKIFESPRFFWVPVIGTPAAEGTHRYAITGFRPAFLTGQTGNATAINPGAMQPEMNNGIDFGSAGVERLHVVYLHPDALPESISDGPVTDYLGVGTKVVRLVE